MNTSDSNSSKRHNNPSFGLELWGPLIPASDCRFCLYTLTTVQMAGGLALWWLPKPRPRILLKLAGSYLMFLSGLELMRLQLIQDPWADDAAKARRQALMKGEKANWWLGPKDYQPVEYSEWKKRVDARLNNTLIQQAQHGQHMKQQSIQDHQQQKSGIKQVAVSSLLNGAKDRYLHLKEKNRELGRRIVATGVPDSVSSNVMIQGARKHKVFKEAEPLDSEDEESPEQLENVLLEDDETIFEWNMTVPWNNLRDETDVQIRLIPHSRGFESVVETDVASEEEQVDVDGKISSVYISLNDESEK